MQTSHGSKKCSVKEILEATVRKVVALMTSFNSDAKFCTEALLKILVLSSQTKITTIILSVVVGALGQNH